MRNCHKDLPEEEFNDILSDSMKELQNSNYPEQYRLEVLKSAINGFSKQKEADKNGERPLYRNRGYEKKERLLNKKLKKSNWYSKDGSKSYVMVPSTPGSKLKKMIETKLNKNVWFIIRDRYVKYFFRAHF